MSSRPDTKSYRPAAFCPTTSFTGQEVPLIFRGENMWIRIGRFGSVYAEGYSGSQDLSESIPTKTLTGTLAWNNGTKIVTGTGTLFKTEIDLGYYVFGDGGASQTELFVVEKIISDTSFLCSKPPTTTLSGKTGYVMPVLFPVGIDRGTAISGKVIQYIKGHYLGVGDGTFRINGNALTNSLVLSSTPQFALLNPVAGTYVINDVGIDKPIVPITLSAQTRVAITNVTAATPIQVTAVGHGRATGDRVPIAQVLGVPEANGSFIVTFVDANNFTLDGTVGTGAYVSGGYVFPSVMRAGSYNVRICRSNSSTLGFSQPSDVIEPLVLVVNQSIKIVFNEAMIEDQDAYDIYCTEFFDNATAGIEGRYMGPWWKVKRVTQTDLIDGTHATGRETGTSYIFSFSDSEISQNGQILTFDNFPPEPCKFVDIINGIPIYFSALGKGTTSLVSGKPGPSAIPSKPSNPEAVFLNKAFTTAGSDYIIGGLNAKGRLYSLCQQTLQNVVLTTVDIEPIAFRSLWSSGFRNPYNMAFVKEYLYAHSTDGIIRSVAGGDDTAAEFEFATDVKDYVKTFPCGHALVAYDPKNKAMCFFYSAIERRSGYWVTIVLPFLIENGVWNPPIILSKANTDFIVSGVATIGSDLTFLAGGRTSVGSIVVGTYIFDGGSVDTKNWYLAWPYSDDGDDYKGKRVKAVNCTGRFRISSTPKIKIYGVTPGDPFNFTALELGIGADSTMDVLPGTGEIEHKNLEVTDFSPYKLYSVRIEGAYTSTPDRLDEINFVFNTSASNM